MIIMQGKKKLWYVVRLCFKLTFSFKRAAALIKYDPLSYINLLNASNVVFLKKKIVYISAGSSLYDIYDLYDLFDSSIDVQEEFK